MLLGGLFRHQQHEGHAHRLAVGSVEGHRAGDADECAHCRFESLDAAVRNRHALSEAGGTQFFTRKQAVKDEAAGNGLVVLEQQSGLLEYALLARDFEVKNDIGGGEELGDEVHGLGAIRPLWRGTGLIPGRVRGAHFTPIRQQVQGTPKRPVWGENRSGMPME